MTRLPQPCGEKKKKSTHATVQDTYKTKGKNLCQEPLPSRTQQKILSVPADARTSIKICVRGGLKGVLSISRSAHIKTLSRTHTSKVSRRWAHLIVARNSKAVVGNKDKSQGAEQTETTVSKRASTFLHFPRRGRPPSERRRANKLGWRTNEDVALERKH